MNHAALAVLLAVLLAVYGTVATESPSCVVVHDARMAKDMQKMFIDQNEMNFDRVFGEAADNDEVYSGTAARLVQLAADGGHATVMMYGQTGSGKTHTMEGYKYEPAPTANN